MTKQEIDTKELKRKIDMGLNSFYGDIDPFREFVICALTRHLFYVANSEKQPKPTFDDWEDLLINKDNLIELLGNIREYQMSVDYDKRLSVSA